MSYVKERAVELIKLMDADDQKIVEEYIQERIASHQQDQSGCLWVGGSMAITCVLIVALFIGIPTCWDATHTERAWKDYSDWQSGQLNTCRTEEMTCQDELNLWKQLRDKKCSRENSLGR